MTIIGICGFQSSGKDTIAEILINKYGFVKLSFACIIKDIVALLFDWPRDRLEGLTKEDRQWREQVDEWWSSSLKMPNLTPRYVLQYFGTELFRKHWHQDFWVKVLEKKLTKYENIVITDCRFENEINLIIEYGGKIIQVQRNLPNWFETYKNGIDVEEAKKLHPSETNWIRCRNDYIIDNNGTIGELNIQVENMIKYISEKTT